jgi:hypothetical protein
MMEKKKIVSGEQVRSKKEEGVRKTKCKKQKKKRAEIKSVICKTVLIT